MSNDPCDKCEELLHGFLDRELTEAEHQEAESHLGDCDYCRRRYHFEDSLRKYIRFTSEERMPAGLMAKLAELRATGPDTLPSA